MNSVFDILSFVSCLGGGSEEGIRIELMVDNNVVMSARPASSTEQMKRHYWNVEQYLDKMAKIRLIDNKSESWGHLNFDSLYFIKTTPLTGFEVDHSSREIAIALDFEIEQPGLFAVDISDPKGLERQSDPGLLTSLVFYR